MKEQIIKYSALSILIIAVVISALVFLNQLSCISVPFSGKDLQSLSDDCKIALNVSVYATNSKNPTTQIGADKALDKCFAGNRAARCKKEFDDYIRDNAGKMEGWLLYERANSVRSVCESANKSG